jgi:hypothetical protein
MHHRWCIAARFVPMLAGATGATDSVRNRRQSRPSLIAVKPDTARRPNNGRNCRSVMSELAIVLLFAAFIAPPSAPDAHARQSAPAPQPAVVAGAATSAGGAERGAQETQRKGKASDCARQDVRCVAAAPVTAK